MVEGGADRMNDFINAMFSQYNGKTIVAVFKDGRQSAIYPADMLDLLKADILIECVYDSETGEILWKGANNGKSLKHEIAW